MAFWNRTPTTEELSGKDDPPESPAPETEEPSYVSVDEFKSFQSRFDQLADALLTQKQEPSAPAPAPTPPVDDVTDEEIEAAWAAADETGEQADIRRARRLEHKRNNANLERVRRENEQRLQSLEQQGTQLIGGVQGQMLQQYLETQKHYKEYRKEIDAQMQQVPVQQRTQQVAQYIYNAVVGQHLDDIQQRETEARVRNRTEKAMDTNDRSSRTQRDTSDEDTFEAVFGERLARPTAQWDGGGQLWSGRHRNPDELANNLGYQDSRSYAKAAQQIMAIEDCPSCFMPMTETIEGGEHRCPTAAATRKLRIPGMR